MVPSKITIDGLASLFGLESAESLDERNTDYVWESGDFAAKYALEHGASESESEAAREAAEGEAQSEVYGKWHGGVLAAAESLFEEHGLTLVPIGKGLRPFEFRICPVKGWKDSLRAVIETINGVGYFYFSSPREFLDSGPYASARVGVLTHLHWIKDHPAVYGGTSAERLFERAFR